MVCPQRSRSFRVPHSDPLGHFREFLKFCNKSQSSRFACRSFWKKQQTAEECSLQYKSLGVHCEAIHMFMLVWRKHTALGCKTVEVPPKNMNHVCSQQQPQKCTTKIFMFTEVYMVTRSLLEIMSQYMCTHCRKSREKVSDWFLQLCHDYKNRKWRSKCKVQCRKSGMQIIKVSDVNKKDLLKAETRRTWWSQ